MVLTQLPQVPPELLSLHLSRSVLLLNHVHDLSIHTRNGEVLRFWCQNIGIKRCSVDEVSRRIVLAHKVVRKAAGRGVATAHGLSALPYQLREMSPRLKRVHVWRAKAVVWLLCVPEVHIVVRVSVTALGKVLAVGATSVLENAGVGSSLRVSGETGVPY
jgi:hypothetical protein